MTDQVFGSFKDQSAQLLGPPREFCKLTISKLEQLVSLQFASLREYTELSLGQLKAAADIAGPEDLKEYLGKQQEFLRTVAEKLTGDAQAMAALGREFTEEAKNIAVQGFATTTKRSS